MDSSYDDKPFSQSSKDEDNNESTQPSNEPGHAYSSPSPSSSADDDDKTVIANPSNIQPNQTSYPTISNAPPPPDHPSNTGYPPLPNNYQSGANYQSGPAYPPPSNNYQSGANYQSGPNYPPPSNNYQSGANYQSGPNYPPPPNNYQSGANYQSGPGYPPPNYQQRPNTGYQPKPRRPKKQTTPLPLWVFIGGIVLTVALLIGLYFIGSDWAEGASQASVAALIIGVLVAIGWFVRTRLRDIVPASKPRRIVSTVFLLVLLIFSGWARSAQGSIHQWQGQSLENQQKWQQAINEYTFSGEQPPDGLDIARTYTSWGLDLSKNHHYNEALTKFAYVIDHFTNTGLDTHPGPDVQQQVARAQTGSIDTRITMAQQSMQSQKYTDATLILDTTLALSYCNDNCRQRVQPLDATSYYQIGNDQLQAKNYSSAIDTFNKILTSFPDAKEVNDTRTNMSKALLGQGENQLHNKNYNDAVDSFNKIVSTYPYPAKARQVHADLSKAIMGQGVTTRASSCTASIPYYQQLAKDYKDTPEGQKAQQELKVPQDIKGHFTNITPQRNYSQIALVQGLYGNMPQGAIFDKWDNAPYKTDIQANGNFVFQGIPQGTYDLLWYSNDGVTEYVEFIYKQSSSTPEYVAQVGPLCTVNMGNVTNITGFTA